MARMGRWGALADARIDIGTLITTKIDVHIMSAFGRQQSVRFRSLKAGKQSSCLSK